jgi:Icc-related predicted phosphoesterase
MRIVCVSDIHSRPLTPPEADVLIIAGDLTYHSSDKELEEFAAWLKAQKAKYKVFIAGNHDKKFQTHPWGTAEYLKRVCAEPNTFYLEQTSVIIEGLVFWGSPWIPKYSLAFQLKSPEHARQHWAKMPDHVDVLVTHGPPHGILDTVKNGKHVGDQQLLAVVQRVKPRLHVFGHIHTGYGQVEIGGTIFINACVCDEDYKPVQEPIVIDLPSKPE